MRVFILLYCLTLIAALCAWMIVTRPAPEPRELDYEQLVFCLDERGFPFGTLAESKRALRFCLLYEQAVE